MCENTGGKYTESGQNWTHLFANKFSATIKILSSIVFQRSLCTVDWLSAFADTSLNCITIPPISDFFPMQNDVLSLKEPTTSRSQLFSNYHILLLHKSNEQYFLLLQGCGAQLTRLYTLDLMQAEETLLQLRSASNSRTIVALQDDTAKTNTEVIMINALFALNTTLRLYSLYHCSY